MLQVFVESLSERKVKNVHGAHSHRSLQHHIASSGSAQDCSSEWIQQHHVTAAYHTLQGVAARTARASGLLGISSAPALCHLSPLSSLSAAGAVGRARNKPVIVQLTGTVWQVRMLDS